MNAAFCAQTMELLPPGPPNPLTGSHLTGRRKDKFGGDAEREVHYAEGSRFASGGSGWQHGLRRSHEKAATSALSHSIARHGSRGIYVPPQPGLDFRTPGSVSHLMLFNFVSLHALLCCFRLCFVEAKSLRGSHFSTTGCFWLRPCFHPN